MPTGQGVGYPQVREQGAHRSGLWEQGYPQVREGVPIGKMSGQRA